MGDVGAVATAVTSVTSLISGILEREDRDGPDKEQYDLTVTLQNAFASNQLDTDEFRLWLDKLLNLTGNPLTPTGDVGFGRRELLHALLINSIRLVHERRLASRAIAKLTAK